MLLYSLITHFTSVLFLIVTFSVDELSRREIHFSKPCR
jgi:hypothetical protein